MQKVHPPSPSQVSHFNLSGDSSDICIKTWVHKALADRSRKYFSIPQCEILFFGKGEWVLCLLLQMPCWREEGLFERDRGAPLHIAVLICSPPHPGEHLTFSTRGPCKGPACICTTLPKAICVVVSSEKPLKSVVDDPSHATSWLPLPGLKPVQHRCV